MLAVGFFVDVLYQFEEVILWPWRMCNLLLLDEVDVNYIQLTDVLLGVKHSNEFICFSLSSVLILSQMF
jgi:hypothetical protein